VPHVHNELGVVPQGSLDIGELGSIAGTDELFLICMHHSILTDLEPKQGAAVHASHHVARRGARNLMFSLVPNLIY
jgi:hypothetical protein